MIGPNVSIGAQAKIGDGVRISNAIILEDVHVMAHAYINNAIIGWSSKIGTWARIQGCSKEEAYKEHGQHEHQSYDICVLGVGSQVLPEVMLRSCLVMPYKEVSTNGEFQVIL